MVVAAQADRDAFRELFTGVASEPVWIRRVLQEITEAIHQELPALNADDEMRGSTFASTDSGLRMMADLVRLDRPPCQPATAL